MGLIKKYSYLRALIVGVPFGLISIFVGINHFIEIPKSVAGLNSTKGEILSFGMKTIYDKGAKSDFNVFYIDLGDYEYYTELGRNIDILKSRLPVILKQSKQAEVWHKKDSQFIEQVSVGDILLIEYTPPYWIAHFFLWLGVIAVTSALIYVIKHPEDLTGSKKS